MASLPPAAELMIALDEALLIPDGPPLHELDPQAVLDWAQAAARGLTFRRDRVRLVRQLLRVLDDEWRSAYAADLLRLQIETRERDRLDRVQGTFWRRRDNFRAAQQPTHVVVDIEAWRRAKAAALCRNTTVGVIVGEVVAAEVVRPRMRDRPAAVGNSEIRLFARLAVEKETWVVLRSLAAGNRMAVERFVGTLVEATFPADITRR
ncbi:MAG: hypothetical protein H0W70_00385 [Actinobacteria bacterium]|nr:hypothetical protein [Actinomycetota bacterium]